MKTFWIWWHRRRAAYHDAEKHRDYGIHFKWHESLSEWHLKQIERIQKSENPFIQKSN